MRASRQLDAAVVVSGSLETECADAITTPDVMACTAELDRTIGFAQPMQAHIVPDAGHGWADVGGAARASVFLLPRLVKTG